MGFTMHMPDRIKAEPEKDVNFAQMDADAREANELKLCKCCHWMGNWGPGGSPVANEDERNQCENFIHDNNYVCPEEYYDGCSQLGCAGHGCSP